MAPTVQRTTLASRMRSVDGDQSSGDLPRCPACDDVLGVYEPIMHVVDTRPRLTSRAAEPGIASSEGQCYHLGCYEHLVGES